MHLLLLWPDEQLFSGSKSAVVPNNRRSPQTSKLKGFMTLGRSKIGGSTSQLFSKKNRSLPAQPPLSSVRRVERHYSRRSNQPRIYPEISTKFGEPELEIDLDLDDEAQVSEDDEEEEADEEGEADLRGWRGELSLSWLSLYSGNTRAAGELLCSTILALISLISTACRHWRGGQSFRFAPS